MSLFSRLKRLLIGKPLHSKLARHERLIVFAALPVFAADALSSSAYATEEILRVLETGTVRGGGSAAGYLPWIGVALVALLWIVIFSYFQTIRAYPQGGGSYRVTSDNLGKVFGLVAGGALLIGYILTVAVSISAGALAIASMAPALIDYVVVMGAGAVAVITLVNLRGARESAAVFAPPTYGFVLLIMLLVAVGAWKLGQGLPVASFEPEPIGRFANLSGFMLFFFLIKAFAAGCTALTGTEAIADGVVAFAEPQPRNAQRTLVLMGIVLTGLLTGITFLAWKLNIEPMHIGDGYKTVLAQIAERVFGEGSALFYATQIATALILILAANTGYADFPRLSMFMARDGYLPRQLTSIGDRLVLQNGIVMLGVISVGVIVLFGGNTHALLPMYAVGVFLSFTLSQAGMVSWFYKNKTGNWRKYISAIGALVTGTVAVMLFSTRFIEGAWLTVLAVAIAVAFFLSVKEHYRRMFGSLALKPGDRIRTTETIVLLPIPRVHRGVLQAVAYCQAIAKDTRALHVGLIEKDTEEIKRQWNEFEIEIPLIILDAPYRSLVDPIMKYVDETIEENPGAMITVVVPQAIPKTWFQSLLHSNFASYLRLALGNRRNVVITNTRYFMDDS